MVAVEGSGRKSLLQVLPPETRGSKGFGAMFLDVFAMCFVTHVIHITNCRQYCFGLLGLNSAVLMLELREGYVYEHNSCNLISCHTHYLLSDR